MTTRRKGIRLIRILFWLGSAALIAKGLSPAGNEMHEERTILPPGCIGRERYDDSSFVEYYFDPSQKMITRHLYRSGELALIDILLLSSPNAGEPLALTRTHAIDAARLLTLAEIKQMLNDRVRRVRVSVRRRH